jgi:hypothetical protein
VAKRVTVEVRPLLVLLAVDPQTWAISQTARSAFRCETELALAVVITKSEGSVYALASCHSTNVLRSEVESGIVRRPAFVFTSRSAPVFASRCLRTRSSD